MKDYALDPETASNGEHELLCLSCGCSTSLSEPPEGPSSDCGEETCPCHAVYWMTVPENVKRALWGDR